MVDTEEEANGGDERVKADVSEAAVESGEEGEESGSGGGGGGEGVVCKCNAANTSYHSDITIFFDRCEEEVPDAHDEYEYEYEETEEVEGDESEAGVDGEEEGEEVERVLPCVVCFPPPLPRGIPWAM